MKKYLFILAAAATVLAACTKELKEVSNENGNDKELVGKTVIEAFNEGAIEGRALVNDSTAVFTWSTGDQIAVFSGETYYISEELPASYNNKAGAKFTFEDDIEAGRSDFAMYPANLVHNGTSARTSAVRKHTAENLSVTFPKDYTLAQVQGEQSPAPRIAVNAAGQGLQFKSICPLLRIKVRDVSKFCDYITIHFPGKKVNGEFVMSSFVAGTSGVALQESTKDSEETITITELPGTFADSLVLNIPLPMGVAGTLEYNNIVVSACDANGDVINKIEVPVKEVASVPTAWVPGRKTARKVVAALPAFTVAGTSIKAATKKVLFAPGNLRAVIDTPPTSTNRMGTASSWFFAEHQYDALKDDPANLLQADSKQGDVIDLFAWVGTGQSKDYTDEQKFGIYYISSGNGSWVGSGGGQTLLRDWGENVIKHGSGDDEVTYPANTWRTPTGDEFAFVLEKRKDASGSLIVHGAKATIIRAAGDTLAFGLIILPDFFKCPYGVKDLIKCYRQGATNYTSNREPAGAVCRDNVYNLEDWAKLEAAGCVFLPLCNHRYTGSNKANLIYPGDAYYWSSTANASDSNTYALAFNDPAVGASKFNASVAHWQSKKSKARNDGCGVRLVRDLN
ncbi:MAG: hypothetical protein J5632_05670 [Bacteroidales bacterium]|nr:hypothetical protein [Bacteroidales bacterium]